MLAKFELGSDVGLPDNPIPANDNLFVLESWILSDKATSSFCQAFWRMCSKGCFTVPYGRGGASTRVYLIAMTARYGHHVSFRIPAVVNP